jgi:hypothetical protein
MTAFRDPSESLAPEAVFYCLWACGPHPHFSDVVDHLAALRSDVYGRGGDAADVLSKAIDEGEVRLRYSEVHSTPYLALDGSVADLIGIRYTFHKLLESNLQPTDIYQGNGSEIVEAYQPLLIDAIQTEGVVWPSK